MATISKKKPTIFFKTSPAVLDLVEKRLQHYEQQVSLFTGDTSTRIGLDLESFKMQGYLSALKDVNQLSYFDYQEFSSRLHKLDVQVQNIVFAVIDQLKTQVWSHKS